MKKILYILMALFALTACNRNESHITVPDSPDPDTGGATIELDVTGVESIDYTDTHIYGFDLSHKLVYHKYYPTQQELSKETFALGTGAYTFVAVLNMGEKFQPETKTSNEALPDISLHALLEHLKAIEESHPKMLTGMIQKQINTGEVSNITIPIKKGAGGIVLSTLKLTLTLPDAAFEEYQRARTKATEPYNLRGVAEFYLTGKEACVSHQTAVLKPTSAAGVYTLETQIAEGTYDLLIWVDYTENGSTKDLYYNTASLKATHLIATDHRYMTGSDRREVFYAKSTVNVAGEQQVNIALERPLAKYNLIAEDVERYRSLMKTNPEKYPALSDLTISILYEGYLPCGFNVSEGKPNHSETGYNYQNPLPAIGTTDTQVEVANDYVMVNGTESSVSVTVVVTDRTGKKISLVKGVEIKYKRGMVTTLKGEFLTAGVINPGINIDTDWENSYEVTF